VARPGRECRGAGHNLKILRKIPASDRDARFNPS
jgi:hypothetical protein